MLCHFGGFFGFLGCLLISRRCRIAITRRSHGCQGREGPLEVPCWLHSSPSLRTRSSTHQSQKLMANTRVLAGHVPAGPLADQLVDGRTVFATGDGRAGPLVLRELGRAVAVSSAQTQTTSYSRAFDLSWASAPSENRRVMRSRRSLPRNLVTEDQP